ncbi:hypothetical protein T8A63_15385 [Sulfitobacter sp. OXR-159]|uniref:hypothetical protein n=1 Tax=Sulfitobacter sp. OXR-159 TaxID=3100174 RepID=UPI002AC99F34|nr:hypothetical protein [Sulfitobacter sp. OXR-159]WPZ28996.1 hypothetical protein T8A63_15385 [Sulfitobacter sp. OXR-159]
MKWRGETQDQWVKRMATWRRWFAWHPVQMDNGDWVWLQSVERIVDHYRGPFLRLDCVYRYRTTVTQ